MQSLASTAKCKEWVSGCWFVKGKVRKGNRATATSWNILSIAKAFDKSISPDPFFAARCTGQTLPGWHGRLHSGTFSALTWSHSKQLFDYCNVMSKSTPQLVTPHVNNWIQLVKNGSVDMDFSKVKIRKGNRATAMSWNILSVVKALVKWLGQKTNKIMLFIEITRNTHFHSIMGSNHFWIPPCSLIIHPACLLNNWEYVFEPSTTPDHWFSYQSCRDLLMS